MPPCRNWWGTPARARWSSSSRAIATYWVKTSTAPPSASDGAEQLVEQVELLRAAGEPRAGLLEVVGRVVADLLEAGEQLQHQPAPGRPRRRARSAPSCRGPAPRRGPPARGSGRAGGRSRSWPAAPGRCRGRTCAGAAGTGRSARRTAAPWSARGRTRSAPAQTLRKALRLPSRPGVAQSRIAQSSVRLFSTGVPVSATRAAEGIVRSARAVEDAGVLDVLRLVGDDQVPTATVGERRRRRAAWCRTSSARSPGRARRRSGEVAASAAAVEAAHRDAGREPARSRPPSCRAARPGRRPASARAAAGAAVQVERDQGDGLAQAHVVGQAGAEAERR